MRQPPVKEMIAFTERWWGHELDELLVARISSAPFKHLEAFRSDWPFHHLFTSGVTSAYPELEMFDLPPLDPGELRPALRSTDHDGLRGLVLLLYSESIVLSSSYAAPFWLAGRSWEERGSKENRYIVAAGFRALMQIRPLVERGLVYFTNLDAHPPFERYLRGSDGTWLLERGLKRRYPDISDDDLAAITGGSDAHSRVLTLASERRVSLVAQDNFEYGLYFNASDFAWEMLTGMGAHRPRKTPRHNIASTLARSAVPDLHTSTKVIAMLRNEEELFAQWRESLHGAIGMIGALRDDNDDIREARVMLAKELDASTYKLRNELAKSKALSLLTRGLHGFGIGLSTALLTTFGNTLEDRVLNVGLGGTLGGVLGVASAVNRPKARHARIVDGVVFDFRALADST